MEARALKWWGWGFENVRLDVASRPVPWAYLQDRLKLDPTTVHAVRLDPDGIMNPGKLVPGSG